MTLKDAIKSVVNSFHPGDLFDTHTVINELLKNPDYHMAYLKGFSENTTVSLYHGLISRLIGTEDSVRSTEKKVKSHTIYGDISNNELWEKIN